MRYDRGTYVSPFARDAYSEVSQNEQPATSADHLLRSYYDYHVDALLRDFLLSGATGDHNLRSMLEAIVKTTFRILLAKDRDEIAGSDAIYVEMQKGIQASDRG